MYSIDSSRSEVLDLALFYLSGGVRCSDGGLDEAVESLECLEVLHLCGDDGIV